MISQTKAEYKVMTGGTRSMESLEFALFEVDVSLHIKFRQADARGVTSRGNYVPRQSCLVVQRVTRIQGEILLNYLNAIALEVGVRNLFKGVLL